MKKGILTLIVLFVLGLSCLPALAASGAAGPAAAADNAGAAADEEVIVAEMSPEMGDTGSGPAAGSSPGAGPGSRGMIWAGMLGLSPDQLARLKALRNQYLTDTRDLRYDLAMRHLEAMKLFTDPKANEASLLAKHRELSALRQKLGDRKAQFMIQARGILTADQLRLIDRHVLSGMMMGGMGAGFRKGTAGGGCGCGCMGMTGHGHPGMMGGGMMGREMTEPGPAGRPMPGR